MQYRLREDIQRHRKEILIFVVLYIAMSLIFGTTCIVKLLVGLPCPFCGITRALQLCCLLRFKEAWQMQPLFPFVAGGIPLFCWSRYGKGKTDRRKIVFLVYFGSVILAAGILYSIRMIELFPHTEPMTWWKTNLLSYLMKMKS